MVEKEKLYKRKHHQQLLLIQIMIYLMDSKNKMKKTHTSSASLSVFKVSVVSTF